jgi:hypothetical protein
LNETSSGADVSDELGQDAAIALCRAEVQLREVSWRRTEYKEKHPLRKGGTLDSILEIFDAEVKASVPSKWQIIRKITEKLQEAQKTNIAKLDALTGGEGTHGESWKKGLPSIESCAIDEVLRVGKLSVAQIYSDAIEKRRESMKAAGFSNYSIARSSHMTALPGTVFFCSLLGNMAYAHLT